jgi:chemotaxis protein methyltransferase CheR
MLTNDQFERTRRLALRLAGIELFERHRDLLFRRYCRTQLHGPGDLDALLSLAERDDPTASREFVDLITTNFTAFFRNAWHFDITAEHALWAAHSRGSARLWSAAAATGEEPYSLAMALIEIFRRDDPPASILATDIDADALDQAQIGQYGRRQIMALDPARRQRFISEAGVDGSGHVIPSVRCLVEFRTLNLVDVTWPLEGSFDVIFCRNMLMYLEACHRYAVLEHMASLLAVDGLLIVDPAEHLGRAERFFSPGVEGVYGKPKKAASRRVPTQMSGDPCGRR